MSEFVAFLTNHKSKFRTNKRFLLPPERVDLFVPCPPGKVPMGLEKMDIENIAMSDALDSAESRLSCKLPQAYRAFMEVVGPGSWCEAWIRHPCYLDFWEDPLIRSSSVGLPEIILADNVDGCGNFVALDSQSSDLYYLCHDPTGYAFLGGFEEWIREITNHWLTDHGGESSYDNLIEFSWWPRIRGW